MEQNEKKIIEVAEYILTTTNKNGIICDSDIKRICSDYGVSQTKTFNRIRPYIEEIDDRVIDNQNMRYHLIDKGCVFVANGMWSGIDKKECKKNRSELIWRIATFSVSIFALIVAIISLINSWNC